MKKELTRREFIQLVLPSKQTIFLLFQFLKWCFFGFIAYLGLKIGLNITSFGWLLILYVIIFLGALGLLLNYYRKFKEWMEEKKLLKLIALISSLERGIDFSLIMVAGVILYKKWQSNPLSTYLLISVFAFFTVIHQYYKKRSEQENPLDSLHSPSDL